MKPSKVLVVAAHPDDETLGCGASLYNAVKSGANVKVIFIGEGSSCRFPLNEKKTIIQNAIETRRKYCLKALKKLEIRNYKFYDLKCGRFDQVSIIDIAKIIENEISIFNPDVLLTHFEYDVHMDHKIVYQACLQATRPKIKNNIHTFLSFEILSATERNFTHEFLPNFFVPIDKKSLKIKNEAMKCYKSETKKFPFPRSIETIENLAKIRGSQSGNNYAEAFKIIRMLNQSLLK